MHVKEIYVIFIHLFDSGKLLIIDLNKKKGKKVGGDFICGLWCLVPLSTIFQLLSWPSVLLVEEIGENHDLRQVTDKLTTDSYFIIIIITLI
jgi:hypothetical protein